jgi:hypothetical protein
MLELIIAPTLSIELHQTYDNLLKDYYKNRTALSKEFLNEVNTGSLSFNTFGYKVNPV